MSFDSGAGFRNERAYPFCPGCGHGLILDALDAALSDLGLDPRRVVLVTDIGCSGLSDQYFTTSAFHGLHGRSITYATGIKLANPDLTVIVFTDVLLNPSTAVRKTRFSPGWRSSIEMSALKSPSFRRRRLSGPMSSDRSGPSFRR